MFFQMALVIIQGHLNLSEKSILGGASLNEQQI